MTKMTLAFIAVVCSLIPAVNAAHSQVSYDGTTFLHGFNSNPLVWVNTPLLRNTIYFGPAGTNAPKLDSSASINTQRAQLRTLLNSYGNRQVLVGHSMGGLVARAAYTQNPANIAGIITVATPHQGAMIANNSATVVLWLEDVRRRVGDAMGQLPFTSRNKIDRLLTGGLSSVEAFAQANFGLGSAAVNDLRTTSPSIQALSRITTDAIPRANVYGTIPFRNAIFRLSVPENQFDEAVRMRNFGISAFRVCRTVGYVLVFTYRVGRKCSRAKKVLERLDASWVKWTNGQTSLGQPIYNPFDGVVDNTRSVYPGLSQSNTALNFRADNTHHRNITNTLVGRTQIANAMLAIGMQRPFPPLAITITGPRTYTTNGTQTWTATVSGGPSSAYHYQWQYRPRGSTAWSPVGISNRYSRAVSVDGTSFDLSVMVTSGSESVLSQINVIPEGPKWCNPKPGVACPK